MKLALPSGIRVYAIGDIHGEADMLAALFDAIDADLAAHPPEGEVVEIFLGDYVDRGPDVPRVIDMVRTPRGHGRVALLGNHEDAMLAALADASRVEEWIAYGAAGTLRGYGVEFDWYRHDVKAMQPMLAAVMPPEHHAFLANLPLTHRIGDVLFVHAGIRPGVALEEQDRTDLIWIRDEFLTSEDDLPVHVVHGHTPVRRPDARFHRTNVDTGAVYGGALTAAVLEGETVRFLSIPAKRR